MASSNHNRTSEVDRTNTEVPNNFANVPPPPMLDHSFTLQAIMEMQRSIGQQTEAINNLGNSINTLSSRTKSVEDETSKINTRLAIAASILAILLVVGGFIIDKVWDSAWVLIAEQIKSK
jgi:hypothetical protein